MTTTDRSRLTLELSPAVACLLDHISTVTGSTKTQIVQTALTDALPELLARADALKKRHGELNQQGKPKR
ncbi:hypothetical protein N5J07_18140 [Comamonas aquatica]|uniref:hypothetical protein n=1 Tax=Comamonas aquatica TaxID=225991 RepID=UPI00244C54E0|nr:hypothetical protein [Comamonas aquatica]MDH1381333.1 hypothetical protein [Comamonas aquatica]